MHAMLDFPKVADMANFVEKVEALRIARGLSVEKLCQLADVRGNTYRGWLDSAAGAGNLVNGPNPGLQKIQKLARVLGTTPGYLANEDDEPPPTPRDVEAQTILMGMARRFGDPVRAAEIFSNHMIVLGVATPADAESIRARARAIARSTTAELDAPPPSAEAPKVTRPIGRNLAPFETPEPPEGDDPADPAPAPSPRKPSRRRARNDSSSG